LGKRTGGLMKKRGVIVIVSGICLLFLVLLINRNVSHENAEASFVDEYLVGDWKSEENQRWEIKKTSSGVQMSVMEKDRLLNQIELENERTYTEKTDIVELENADNSYRFIFSEDKKDMTVIVGSVIGDSSLAPIFLSRAEEK
jgi:hypothetical protein